MVPMPMAVRRMTAEGLVKGGFISPGAVCREW